MANIKVAVVNASTVLKSSQVKAVVPALQTQAHWDLAAAWGIDAALTFVPKGLAVGRILVAHHPR